MSACPKELKGIVLAVSIGIIAHIAAPYLPSLLGGILTALLLGMVAGNFFRLPEDYQAGISLTSGRLLEVSILFLAFGINFGHIARLGAVSFSIIAVMVFSMLLITYFLSARVKCPGSTGWLIGFGTAICGSSAIAALAPGVAKNKEDVAIAMAVINLLGSLFMVLMPVLIPLVSNFADVAENSGMFIGGTLHSVGNVAGAGYAVSDVVGEAAITIKMARVALLSPALLFFHYLLNRNRSGEVKKKFSLPWYLWGFLAITVLGSFVNFPATLLDTMEEGGKLILTIAMAAIGLKVSFRTLYFSGRKGMVFGLIIFMVQVLLLAGLMWFL